MAEYDNTNRGVLFHQANKPKDTYPDYNGNINVDGEEYWLSGWKKMDRNGNPLLSLSIKKKEDQRQDTVVDDISDDPIDLSAIPF